MNEKSVIEKKLWPDSFSEEQYDILCKCVIENSMNNWIVYRRRNRKTPILLRGAIFKELDLSKANFKNADLTQADFSRTKLHKTQFMNAQLHGARFDGADIVDSDFLAGEMVNTRFTSVIANNVNFQFADLSNSDFHEASISKSNFNRANLEKANFHGTDISYCSFDHSILNGANITESKLDSASFNAAIVDGETLIWDCSFDLDTNFAGVGLMNARIEPQLLSRFETNVRRIWWKSHLLDRKENTDKVFKENRIIYFFKWAIDRSIIGLTKLFWWTTDYGSSTLRLLISLFITSIIFALLYAFIPNITNEEFHSMPILLRLVRSFYFSIVTITTVGFGDIIANNTSILGHIILILHLLSGYTLLGALIVRLGILFQNLPEAKLLKKEKTNE